MTTSEYTSNTGIYIIRNTISNHFYIGSAVNIKRRWLEHLSKLRRNCHHNPYMQKVWNKYGEQSFSFGILENCDSKDVFVREQIYLDIFYPMPKCMNNNIHAQGGSTKGKKRSEEVKRKLSLIRKGKPSTIKYTDEVRKHIGDATRGRKHSEETKRKIGESGRGKKHSEDTKLKISLSQKGKPKSDEQKRKLSEAKAGKKLSPESLQKRRIKMIETNKLRRESRMQPKLEANRPSLFDLLPEEATS